MEVAGRVERNQPKLNKEKSEAIIFLPAKQRVDLSAEVSLTTAGPRVISTSLVRNLGVLCDGSSGCTDSNVILL